MFTFICYVFSTLIAINIVLGVDECSIDYLAQWPATGCGFLAVDQKKLGIKDFKCRVCNPSSELKLKHDQCATFTEKIRSVLQIWKKIDTKPDECDDEHEGFLCDYVIDCDNTIGSGGTTVLKTKVPANKWRRDKFYTECAESYLYI